jgi:gliding motility-associated lipoprotein GldD
MRNLVSSNSIIKGILLSLFFIMLACQNSQQPKPRGYFRITLPEKQYTETDSTLPYTFEYPEYAKVIPDKGYNQGSYWINLVFPRFNAQIHLSYKSINNNLYQILEDNRELAFKHSVKADAIKERLFQSPEKNVYGILYEIRGNTASPIQFFATDSTQHFLRGSLYFNTTPNKDSIAPVLDFIKTDIEHLMETIAWKEL